METLPELLRRRARETPDLVAATFLPDGEGEGVDRTWSALERGSRAVGAGLSADGAPGDRVLLVLDEGHEALEALLGCLRSRRLAVAVPAPEPGRPGRALDRVRAVAADALPSVVLTDRARAAGLPWSELAPGARVLVVDALPHRELAEPAIGPPDLAWLQYTSGSTAEPKGVAVSHGNLAQQLVDFDMPLRHTPGDALVSWLPTTHDLGLVYGRLLPLWKGLRAVSFPPAAFVARPARWMEVVSRFRATHTAAPNFAFDLAADRVTPQEVARLDLSRVRVVLNGAEPIRRPSEAAFLRTYTPAGLRPDALVHAMGMSEATAKIVATEAGAVPGFVDLDGSAYAGGRVVVVAPGTAGARTVASNGRPHGGARVVVVDPETRRPVGEDRVGELWVTGPSVAVGYWRRPEATEATFGARTADGDGPFLRTGDLAFLRGGELYLSGRRKDTILLRGENHHAEDLEAAVVGRHPELRAGAVVAFAMPDEGLALAIEVSGDPSPVFAAAALALGEHGVAPEVLFAIPPRATPRTTSGKLRRGAARDLCLTGGATARWQPTGAAPSGLRARLLATPSRRRVDLLVAHLQGQVGARLGVPADDVDPERPLGQLGLDSVAAVALVDAVGAELGLSLPGSLSFERPTIVALADDLVGRV